MLGIWILRGKVACEVNKLGVAMVCNLARQSSETSKQVRHRHDYLDRRSPYMFGPRTEDRGPRTEDRGPEFLALDRGPRTEDPNSWPHYNEASRRSKSRISH